MKKLILLFIGVISMSNIYAQDISDALRYSEDEIQGSARFRAMSGAFGALGGDMSAVSINPAGAAIFSQSHASFSLSSITTDNEISFLNNSGNSSDSSFDINQAGASFVLKNTNSDSNWNKIVLSIAYDKSKNYSNNWSTSGTNTNSIDNYFTEPTLNQEIPFGVLKLLPGEFLEEAYADIGANFGYNYQQVFLGYWAGIIDPVNLDNDTNDDNLDYNSNIAAGNFNQQYSHIATGNNGKFSFNIATQYKDNLYLGLNLNSHFINYEKAVRFRESNNNDGSVVNNLIFDNYLTTNGNGFSFQLGAITKLTKEFRVGLAYNSPTWYRITDETVQYINSNNADQDIEFISDITNIFPVYKLQTPAKVTGSLAYVFGKQGLLSFDYSRKDYSQTKFKPASDPVFVSQNNEISNNLKAASTYRIGGEYKHKEFSFRAGYRMEESPYKNEKTIGNLTGYSLGLGYNFGNTKLDLAFDNSERSTDNQLFNVGLTDAATLNSKNTNITLSLSFNL